MKKSLDIVDKLKVLASEVNLTHPELSEKINKLIYGMINKQDIAQIKIRTNLEHALQDYYQLQLDAVGFNVNHWKNTLKALLEKIVNLNSTGTKRLYYFDSDEIDKLIEIENNEVGGAFDAAMEHLNLDDEYYYKFYNPSLTFIDLCITANIKPFFFHRPKFSK